MNKKIRRLSWVTLLLLFAVIGFILGSLITYMQYKTPLAGCRVSQLPNYEYEEIQLQEPMQKMFQNYFGKQHSFSRHYIPKDISLKEYYNTLNSGGFYYLKTIDNKTFACGYFK